MAVVVIAGEGLGTDLWVELDVVYALSVAVPKSSVRGLRERSVEDSGGGGLCVWGGGGAGSVCMVSTGV